MDELQGHTDELQGHMDELHFINTCLLYREQSYKCSLQRHLEILCAPRNLRVQPFNDFFFFFVPGV